MGESAIAPGERARGQLGHLLARGAVEDDGARAQGLEERGELGAVAGLALGRVLERGLVLGNGQALLREELPGFSVPQRGDSRDLHVQVLVLQEGIFGGFQLPEELAADYSRAHKPDLRKIIKKNTICGY